MENKPDLKDDNETRWLLPWGFLTALIALFLTADYLTPSGFGPRFDYWMAFLLGVYIAQVNLIAMWAALAPGNVLTRLPWSLLLATSMWIATVLGMPEHETRGTLGEARALAVVLLISVFIAQVPLWIASRAFRWRLVSWQTSREDAMRGKAQFQIRHVMISMVFLSIALGLSRLVVSGLKPSAFHWEDEFAALLIAMTVSNLIVTVPCIWGAFVPVRFLAPACIGWALYCAFISVTEVGILIMILGSPGDEPVFQIFTLMNLTQGAAVFGTLLILRAMGFQLLRIPKG